MRWPFEGRRVAVWPTLLLLCYLGLIAGLLANYLILKTARPYIYQHIEEVPPTDVGLLLGASKYIRGGGLNPHTLYRIHAAVELFQKGKIRHLLVSGDSGGRYYDEAGTIRDDLIALGIPDSAITLDVAGFRTLDSVVRARRVFGQQRITIISQAYHNYRAVFLARYQGLDARAYCARAVPFELSARTELREVLARVKAVLDVYLLDVQPQVIGERIPIEVRSARR